jgi:hypothetical protein
VERQEPRILEGVPVHPPGRKKVSFAVPPAPPPSEASEEEPVLPLTQPSPKEGVDLNLEPEKEVGGSCVED